MKREWAADSELHGMLVYDKIRQQEDMQGRAGAQKGGDNMVDMRVELCGIELDNPVMAASGTSDTDMSLQSFTT